MRKKRKRKLRAFSHENQRREYREYTGISKFGKHLHEKLCTAEKETQSIVATPTFTRCSFKYRRGIS